MPSKICVKCFDITRIWFNYRQLCLNSQVYLESLCKDSIKSEEFDGNVGDYLEYLLEDLQSFRAEACNKNMKLKVNPNLVNVMNSSSESEIDFIEEALPLEQIDSDPEIQNILQSIKKEDNSEVTQDDEIVEHYDNEDGLFTETGNTKDIKTKRRRRTVQQRDERKKSRGSVSVPKKYLRPPSPGSYMCSICGNVYTKKSSFTYHMSLHSNVKPHECELCGKTFRQVCELKNHMRRHTGEKPYKCSFCERRFIDRSEKHRHERVHTNTRPYVCNVKDCGKSFMYSAILKNHSKLHSGEKDYNCLVCKKAFTLQHQLKAHLQTLTHKQKEAQYVSAGYEVVYE